MSTAQTDKGPASGKWGLIAALIIGTVLLIAAIWSLSRALNKSSPHSSVALTNTAAEMNVALTQEEMERQHEMAEQLTVPVIQSPAAAQSAVIPTKQNNDEVKLQKAKTKVNQMIAKRMKQYIKDNPDRDNRELEEQIKRREKQCAQ